MARTAVLYVLPALLIATGWLRLEDPGPRRGVFWMLLLALLPALVRPLWARALAAAGAMLVAVSIAFDLSPIDARPFDGEREFVGPLLSGFREGFLEFYDIPQPFTQAEHPLMHGVVLAAIFGFSLAVALAVGARRPLAAGAVLLVGSAWPATLVPGSDLSRGALTLVALLALLAAGGRTAPRSYRPAALAGVAIVVASLAASSSPAVAKDGVFAWKEWDFYDRPDDPVGVRYVWDANYDGIRFPKAKTTVLTIKGPRRPLYWRAATLDDFSQDRWLEATTIVHVSDAATRVPDPLLPARANNDGSWIQTEVQVEALRDDHLVAPSMPVAFDPGDLDVVEYRPGGVAVAQDPLEHDQRYQVWSYAPQPTPRQLARVRPLPRDPETLSRYLEVTVGRSVLPFGAPGREAQLARLIEGPAASSAVAQYVPLYETARRVVGRPRNQYAAVVALEAWFRSEGGFRYDERPPQPLFGRPPLVDFVLGPKRGYCQLYAGAMTLMLRYLGIPARVAVGFTSGTVDGSGSRWTVTDHDAHAWVEVWFNGWGWLPFDPTPARGQLSSPYTIASPIFDVRGAAQQLATSAASPFTRQLRRKLEQVEGNPFRDDTPGAISIDLTRERGESLLRLLALVAAVLAAAVTLTKLVRRRSRYLTRDPRRLAAACRRELVDFLADQGVSAPRSATVEELGELVRTRFALDTTRFVEAVSAARYGRTAEARSAARRARREIRVLRAELRGRVGLPRRMRGALSLRSFSV